ncbi:MAG: hypothetical protein AABY28_01175 [Candidatus Omnitrophota bacterium]
MRDLLYKNLTSSDGKKRILASSEIVDKEGVRSIIRRKFVCMVKEIKDNKMGEKPLPYLYVLKERNTFEQKERFYCRLKGSVYAVSGRRLFLILYTHSLKISLATLQKQP